MYSTTYFALCGVGGLLACASSHVATTPIDVVKCNAQIRPNVFPTARAGAAAILSGAPAARELGFRAGVPGLFKGWAPTIVGYGAQGFCKFGLYELFKHRIADAVGPDAARRHRDVVALAAGAGAEMIGDIFLSPFEAIKVRLQTHPDFARGMVDGLPRLVRQEGFASLYAGLAPLIGRQVPYTVVKFVSFERITDALYHLTPRPKHELTTLEQMGVVVTAGYLAGFLCGVASQPADTLVSLVNSAAPKHHLAAAPLMTAAAGATAGATSSTAAVVDVQETARERLASAYRQVGFRGLWKGFWPRVLMIGTITAAQFLVYGGFRLSVGLPTPGGDAHRHDAPVASGPAVSRKR